MNLRAGIVLAITFLLFVACYVGPADDARGGACVGGGSAGACKPDLASIQSTIFAKSCNGTGCHNATDRAAALDLTATDLAAQLVGQRSNCGSALLVNPGYPETSVLLDKLSAAPACGERMPQSQCELPDGDKGCIRDWIASLTPGLAPDSGAYCGDTETSISNCGACGNACPTGAACEAGKCACPGGAVVCNGECVDPKSDVVNCGACGNACGSGTPYCNAGKCAADCGSLFTCPDKSCVSDNQANPLNCGASCVACGSGEHCVAGTCACPPDKPLDCNGTCVASDANNCGQCGAICAPGQTCTNNECTCGGANVDYLSVIQPIFTRACATAGCHVKNAGVNVEKLDLSGPDARSRIVNVDAKQCSDATLLVKPSDPQTSYLMRKLSANSAGYCGTGTQQMPKKGQSLPVTDLANIGAWICAGAK